MTKRFLGLWLIVGGCGSGPTAYPSQLHAQSTWGQEAGVPGRANAGPITRGGEVVLQGDLPADVLETGVRRVSNGIAACYGTVVRDDASVMGEAIVTFTVMPDGSLRGVETNSTSLGESVTSCVSRQFSKIVLEEGVVTDAVGVRYPLVFSPGETG